MVQFIALHSIRRHLLSAINLSPRFPDLDIDIPEIYVTPNGHMIWEFDGVNDEF
ncbi:MAG: hypothetical protein KDB00_21765 [Planctomycetales bacterium]|nr:hypothetical protein [Planctomycetales bacterium]